jgi:hypothetical protein
MGHAIAQAVSRLPLTSDARVRTRVCTCGVCGGQSGIGTGSSTSSSVFPISIIPSWLSIILLSGRWTVDPLVASFRRYHKTLPWRSRDVCLMAITNEQMDLGVWNLLRRQNIHNMPTDSMWNNVYWHKCPLNFNGFNDFAQHKVALCLHRKYDLLKKK